MYAYWILLLNANIEIPNKVKRHKRWSQHQNNITVVAKRKGRQKENTVFENSLKRMNSKIQKVSKLSWKPLKNDSFPESNCGRGKWIFRETFPPIFWVILVKICHILNVENFVNPSKNKPWQRLTFPPDTTKSLFIHYPVDCFPFLAWL